MSTDSLFLGSGDLFDCRLVQENRTIESAIIQQLEQFKILSSILIVNLLIYLF